MLNRFPHFVKGLLISTASLFVLLATTNVAFAKNRVARYRINRPRIYRAYHRIRRNTRRSRHVRRNNRYNVFKTTPWRRFRVTRNSTRINSRLPKMRLLTSFPNVYRGGRWPQSLNVDKAGHYAYIGFDSFTNDGSKILKYNLRHRHFSKTSRTFRGGHAQAVSSDNRGRLWFVNRTSNDESGDHQGPINKGSFVEVSPRSLRPVYRKWFKFGHNDMGDNLAFTNKYGVFNVSRIWGRNHTSSHYRRHMLVIYHTNNLSRKGSRWEHLLALRKTPGFYLIQAVGYNPRNHRLYIASSEPNDVISLPVPKLLKRALRRKDVRIAPVRLGYGREIEGLSFDHKGYMYLLLGSPGQLFRSRRPVTK